MLRVVFFCESQEMHHFTSVVHWLLWCKPWYLFLMTTGKIWELLVIFIKNVVAVAAYSRLASRSQAKFQTMKLSPLSAPRAAAPAQSTISTCCSLRFSPRSCSDVNLTCTVPVAFPRHFRSKKRSHLMAAYLACQSVAGMGVFPRHIWHKTSFIPTCVKSRSLPVNKARWRNHVTDLLWVQYSWSHGSASRDGSSSQCDGPVPPGPSRMTARQGSAVQVPDSAKDDGSSRRVTSQQGGTTRQRMTSQRSWTTQQAWLTQHMMMTTQQAFADPAHDVDDPAHAPEEVLQLPAKRLGDRLSKSERAMTTQEVRGFQRVCGGTAQLRWVRTPQIKKWVSQARGDEPVVQATPVGNTPAAR